MTPDPERFYVCFELADDEEEAARKFEARYGQPPDFIFDSKGLLFVGPIPKPAPLPEPEASMAASVEGWGE
jgi:hypothetical protein